MEKTQTIINTVLKAVALGLAVATLVLGYTGIGDTKTQLSLLGLSVFALAVVTLQKENQPDSGRRTFP